MIDLSKLEAVLNYADNHQVKNVRYHLGLQTVIGYDLQYRTYNKLKEWMLKKGYSVVGAFNYSKFVDGLDGIVISTEKRNCLVFVYFD